MSCINYEKDGEQPVPPVAIGERSETDLLTTYHVTLLEALAVEAQHPEGSEEEDKLMALLDDLWYAMDREDQLKANEMARDVGYSDEE